MLPVPGDLRLFQNMHMYKVERIYKSVTEHRLGIKSLKYYLLMSLQYHLRSKQHMHNDHQ